MSDLSRGARCYIGAMVVLATVGTALALFVSPQPNRADLAIASAVIACIAVAWSFPVLIQSGKWLYVDAAPAFVAVLLLPLGLGMLAGGVGTAVAHGLRRTHRDVAEASYNGAQGALCVAVGSLTLAAFGWDPEAPTFGRLLMVLGIVTAATAIYIFNSVVLATMIALHRGRNPLRVWVATTLRGDPVSVVTFSSLTGIGVVAAILLGSYPWADILLLPPVVSMFFIIRYHTRRQREAASALEGSQASLAEAQRIAKLGSWEWDLRNGRQLWSDELYRILGLSRANVPPTVDALLNRTHLYDRDRLAAAIAAAAERGRPFNLDHGIVLEDGAERSVRQQCEIVRDGGGNAVRLVASIHDITESKALQKQLAHRAFHDSLTNLPNRALFTERLQHALSTSSRLGKQVAVLFLDLDGFKLVNDGLGHEIGDRLLVALAGRLQAQLQPGDVAARFGGDEFTVLLDRLESPESAMNWAKWAASSISEPFALEGHEAVVGVSIGIAVGVVGRATATTLLRDADTALYQAKASGKNQIAIFEPRMYAEALRKLDLQVELRKAVERSEIVLHYQPVVDLSSGDLVGVEALARWQHPTRGLLSPEAFLPLAEETGLILPLGEWVLAEACSQVAAWGRIYPSAKSLKVGVNLSVRQLRTPRLIADIANTLRESGLPPEQLELEITEEIVAKDLKAVASALEEIQSLGVRLALDDVGSGHSSLGHFRHLTFDSLKLDGSFLIDLDRDGRSRAIAEAVAGLAGALGIQVTAEGIESMDQLVLARGLGCQLGQGFNFARPLRPEALATMLDRQTIFPIAEVIVHRSENRRDLDTSDSLVSVG